MKITGKIKKRYIAAGLLLTGALLPVVGVPAGVSAAIVAALKLVSE